MVYKFSTIFYKESHNGELVHEFRFILYKALSGQPIWLASG
jgi:hypothetical protein